ncbi:MAG TPA: hypothetical protein VFO65_06160, partial [Acidimicrobiales bacterium]|nr:hypothetical protein [Acidimicrobiales bacterium]
RRGEAHLWLLLEETLAEIRRATPAGTLATPGDAPWEARRNFLYVAEALAAVGLVRPALARAITQELDDALAVRELLEADAFAGQGLPVQALVPAVPVPGGAAIWLEAEIERHLNLVAGFDPERYPQGAVRTLDILAGPAGALVAAGALRPDCLLLAELAATLVKAGFPLEGAERATGPGELPRSGGRPRSEWVRFLRDVRRQGVEPGPRRVLEVHQRIGDLGGRPLTLTSMVLSPEALCLRVVLGRREPAEPHSPLGDDELRLVWLARAVDDRGCLHLGPPGVPAGDLTVAAEFQLRPGVEPGVSGLDICVTRAGRRVETTVDL